MGPLAVQNEGVVSGEPWVLGLWRLLAMDTLGYLPTESVFNLKVTDLELGEIRTFFIRESRS